MFRIFTWCSFWFFFYSIWHLSCHDSSLKDFLYRSIDTSNWMKPSAENINERLWTQFDITKCQWQNNIRTFSRESIDFFFSILVSQVFLHFFFAIKYHFWRGCSSFQNHQFLRMALICFLFAQCSIHFMCDCMIQEEF